MDFLDETKYRLYTSTKLQKYKIGERIKGQKGHDCDLQKPSFLPHLTRPGKSRGKMSQKRYKMTSGAYRVCNFFQILSYLCYHFPRIYFVLAFLLSFDIKIFTVRKCYYFCVVIFSIITCWALSFLLPSDEKI